jgi:hypothetical protein
MLAVTDFLPTATVTAEPAEPAEEPLPDVVDDENEETEDSESEQDESDESSDDESDDTAARVAVFERIEQQFFIKMAVQAASAAFIGVAIIMHGISTASACSF